jgi:dolichol-phosphate mannosyltransferase
MERAQGDLLICMDADLSHPPESIPELITALEDPATDFVIGSRYVPGGSTEEGWGLFRWLNSKVATLLARPLTSTSDPMAGFFGLRREAFSKARELNPIGYKIGLELLVKCGCRGVREVPIRFANRLHGESKLSLREQLNYVRHLRRLYRFRFGVWARCAEFLLVGLSGAFVDLGVLSLLLTGLAFEVARPLAILTAMTWNFVLNRTFTFEDSRHHSIARQYAGFVAACSLGAMANWVTSVGLIRSVTVLAGHPLIAAAAGVIVGAAFNFLLCNRLVFRNKQEAGSCGIR